MIQSMTGFATKSFMLTTLEGEKTNVSINLKSLNYRFFEATCKLPFPFSHLEHTFIKLFKKKLHRGHVYFTIHLTNPNIFRSTIKPALSTVRGYLQAINQIKDQYKLTDQVSLDLIMQLPNIFAVSEQKIDEAKKMDLHYHYKKYAIVKKTTYA